MTAQKTIKKLQSEGLTALRIAEILGVSTNSIKRYVNGSDPSHRCQIRIDINYKKYLLICRIDSI